MLKSLRKGNFGGSGKAIPQSPVEKQFRMRVGNRLIAEALCGQSQKSLSFLHPKNLFKDQVRALEKLVILPGRSGLAQKMTGTKYCLPLKDLLAISPLQVSSSG